MYSYDNYGWLSESPIPDRQTDIVPMASEGDMRPNFTGHKWLLQKYSPPVPVVSEVRILSKLAYMNRFTDEELAAIYTAAKASVAVEIWLEKFKLASEIALDDPRTVAGVQALEAAGLIAAGRSAEVLA